jgi:hypothetical protein
MPMIKFDIKLLPILDVFQNLGFGKTSQIINDLTRLLTTLHVY